DADRHFYRPPRIAPEHFSCGRGQTRDAIAGPANDDRLPGLLYEDWRRVLSAVVQSPPHFIAGILIERDDAGSMTADMQNDEFFIDQRSRGDSPDGHVDAVLLVEVL